MTKPGPSKEYRDLLKGNITPEQYVTKVKKDVDRRLGNAAGSAQQRAR
jgi:hypothetical protein